MLLLQSKVFLVSRMNGYKLFETSLRFFNKSLFQNEGNPRQHLPKSMDLTHGVVIHRTHAQHTAAVLQPQARGHL